MKDAEDRKDVFVNYCKHLSEGYPKEAFFYKVNWRTVEKYIKDYPDELSTILKDEAYAKRFKHWFEEGKKLMRGEYKNGSPVVWQTIMRNMFKDYGWDKESAGSDNKQNVALFSDAHGLNEPDQAVSEADLLD